VEGVVTHAIDQTARDLLASIAHLKALYADPAVVPFGRCRARDKVFALAEKLESALSEPVRIKPWEPYNGRSA
jgi:hypothetical protein